MAQAPDTASFASDGHGATWSDLRRRDTSVARTRAVALLLAILLVVVAPLPGACAQAPNEDVTSELQLHHFDVGQADATLVQAPEGTVLIDAGHWQRDDVVPHLQRVGVDSIDLLILTHPHADHIGQVPQVIDAFPVTEVWMTGWEHETRTFERALDAVLASDAGYHEPRAGERVAFGDPRIEVVNPVEPLADIHDNLTVRVVFGEFAALYTGDAEREHEAQIGLCTGRTNDSAG